MKCAPGKKGFGKSCYDESELKQIATSVGVPVSVPITSLWSLLKKAMQSRCGDDERCWAKHAQNQGARNRLMACFRPEKPVEWQREPRTWLSNVDIHKVLSQYETANPSFDFLGVVPLDFAERTSQNTCIVDRMCRLDINSLADQGKTSLACVVNLDRHDGDGSHWVAFFVRLKGKNRGTYFYDSVARSPPGPIRKFLETVVESARVRDPEHPFRHNTQRRQYKDTECGVFCIRFVEDMIGGKRFETVCKSMPYDDGAFALRAKYFNDPIAV